MSVDAARQFVDTNVLLYAHDATSGDKHVRARDLLSHLWDQGGACLSIQVLQEFYVVATRKLTRPLARAEARRIVELLSHWRAFAPTAADVVAAIDLQERVGSSFWDAMILHAAARLGCAVLWSED